MPPVELVLLRGLGRESGHWGDFIPLLESQDFCQSVTCIDLPGTGRYRNLTSPLTIQETAQFVISQLPESSSAGIVSESQSQTKTHSERGDGAGKILGSKRVLLAVSLGAMVGLEILSKEPHLFDQAFVMNTSFKNLSPFYHRLQWSGMKRFVEILKARGDLETRELEVLKMVSNREDRWQEVSLKWADLARKRPMQVKNFIRQLISASLYKLPAEPPSVPILVMNSAADQMVDPDCSIQLSEAWGLPLVTHPTAGHDLCIDDPDWVIEQLKLNLE